MAGIVVPGVATNYPSPLKALASPFGKEPNEGRYQIPVEIDWGVMGGANFTVSMNLQNSADTKAITQICALHVDNSACGADVQFVFTDTSETITIPAYTAYALVPVFSRSLQFFVVAGINSEVVESNDVTRFTMFNFVPPPVVVTETVEQSIASVTGIDMGTASTTLVPSTVNGTLEGGMITLGLAASNTGSGTWALEDGTGKIIAQGLIQVSSGSKINLVLWEQNGINVRFTNGLKMVCTQSAVIGGTISASLYYRTP